MKKKRNSKYLGYLGFMGFLGIQYFVNYNVRTLSCFAFFGFFGYFWINRIANDMIDECYIENSKKAKAFTLNIALIELAVLCIIIPLKFISKEFLTVFSAFCFAALIVFYSIAFYRFEKM